MKKAIVNPGWLSCVINRNICQRARNYLTLNGIELTSSIKDANYIIYAGCAVTEDTELQSLIELSYIEKKVSENDFEQKIILIGCFDKINKKTRGVHIDENGESKEKLISEKYVTDESSNFVKVSLYDYTVLDNIINATIPFDQVPFPSVVSPVHGVEGVFFSFSAMKGFDKDKTTQMQKNFLDQSKYQSMIVSNGFLFPSTGEVLSDYGYKQVMIGQGCKNNCAYCAIKISKRKVVSVSSSTILSQIKGLIENGDTKIVLLCDDMASWGLDIGETWIDLISSIIKIDNPNLKIALFNLRVEDLINKREFFDSAIETGKISYIGLMGQHVSKRILKDMNREPFETENT